MARESTQRITADGNLVDTSAHHRLRATLHDLRQPLAAMFALADQARSVPGMPAEARSSIDLLIEQIEEIAQVAAEGLAGDEAEADGLVELDRVLDSVVDTFSLTWTGRIERSGWLGDLVVPGDRVILRRCLVNLVENATRAAGPDGVVVVTVHCDAAAVRIVVDDDGPGFGHVPSRTGLGLEATRQALESLGGALAVGLPSATGGSRVALSLPLSDSAG